jgi:hypothetical protein
VYRSSSGAAMSQVEVKMKVDSKERKVDEGEEEINGLDEKISGPKDDTAFEEDVNF